MASVPREILSQHIAVLGKTGSGKTSTAKLAIEQVFAEGARVCILDPIKSDWWGLTSSADGKRAGLPFHILGGPRGHVPLHASAGKAVAEIVGSGQLSLSIIDMADFEPGGQAKFFVDFAPTLLRKMRGVVYLVIEEAHLFAPKERSGIGAENLSIHWAKTLATAGRSKGIRLVLVTQRTQALHNALLGSCDTLIAHRLTAPADQEPVVKWLKANTSKEVLERVSSSLASLTTGHGWVCSGEAKIFEAVHFNRIATYDNTATPTGDGEAREVKTAAVDQEKLRAIIGEAVEKAKADDPRELRKRIAALEQDIKKTASSPAPLPVEVRVEIPVLTADERTTLVVLAQSALDLADKLDLHSTAMRNSAAALNARLAAPVNVSKAAHIMRAERTQDRSPKAGARPTERTVGPVQRPQASSNGHLPVGEKATLIAAAQYPDGLTREQATILTGYKRSTRDAYIQRLVGRGYIDLNGSHVHVTEAGIAALGADYEPLPTGEALRAYWLDRLPSGEQAVLAVVLGAYPHDLEREAIDEKTDFKRSTRDAYIQRLIARKLVTAGRGTVRASDVLFEGE